MSKRFHELKTHPAMFQDIMAGDKTFEVRKDDRGFRVGDHLLLHEWPVEGRDCTCSQPDCSRRTNRYYVKVTYILRGGEWGIEKGYVVMAIEQENP